jgi:hypothetical protein
MSVCVFRPPGRSYLEFSEQRQPQFIKNHKSNVYASYGFAGKSCLHSGLIGGLSPGLFRMVAKKIGPMIRANGDQARV